MFKDGNCYDIEIYWNYMKKYDYLVALTLSVIMWAL